MSRIWGWLRRGRPTRRSDRYGRVASWLLVGPALEPAGYATLAGEGVTHVLDLRSEASDDPEVLRSLDLQWARVPIEDRAAPTREQLAEITAWLDQTTREPVLYVHCEGGLGRSPTIAIALLMQRGFTLAEAHGFVQAALPAAAPTAAQEAWLRELYGSLK